IHPRCIFSRIRRPPTPSLFPYTDALPILHAVASVAIPHAAEYAIFRFADAVAEGRPKDALAILNDLLAVGQPPLVILSMIARQRSEEHTSELQSREKLVCRLLPEKKKTK